MARCDRFVAENKANDQRTPFQRDRDRILYSSAFRRLAGVTQVAGAAEGHPFHNRLTHSMKVGQLSRRIAEYVIDHPHDPRQKELAGDFEIDPEVAEAAGLAHDLGHAPFGHVGESTLHECACEVLRLEEGAVDGFEGNPQTFRILTRLAVHRHDRDGLNLTRATLAATLKYPWLYDPEHPKRRRKWGAYRSEKDFLAFATTELSCARSSECEIMEWADDLAYSVHDLEDFYRAGLLPLGDIARLSDEADRLCKSVAGSMPRREGEDPYQAAFDACREIFSHLREDLYAPYCGSREQRGALRWFTSFSIGSLLRQFRLREPTTENRSCAEIDERARDKAALLKGLMWHYVFRHPSLAAQQEGQRRVLRDLFEVMLDAAEGSRNRDLLPRTTRDLLDKELSAESQPAEVARLRAVLDSIVGMTEDEVYRMHRRLMGSEAGRIGDRIVD